MDGESLTERKKKCVEALVNENNVAKVKEKKNHRADIEVAIINCWVMFRCMPKIKTQEKCHNLFLKICFKINLF